MPSPKSGNPGNLISPVEPRKANEAGDADPGEVEKQHTPDPDKPHWIEIVLLDEEGKSFAGERYRVTLPDGSTVASGTLDSNGFARVTGIDPGTCQVSFPELDDDQWSK